MNKISNLCCEALNSLTRKLNRIDAEDATMIVFITVIFIIILIIIMMIVIIITTLLIIVMALLIISFLF